MEKCIIFDLDGTLLDSMPVWRGTGKSYLEKHHLPVPDDLISTLKKQTLPETAQYFRTKLGATQSVQEICDEIIAHVSDQYAHHIPLKPYAREYLEMEQKKGTKMCILTASEAGYIHGALERLNILPYFDFVATCTEVGGNKHDSDVFERMMKRLGGTIENTIVFEDAYYAIQGAKSGGFQVYAIADESAASEKERIEQTADRYIQSYQELL